MAALWRKHRDNGYLLAEWLTCIFLCEILLFGLYMGIDGYEKTVARIQAEIAAREFAQDLQRIQEWALAGSDTGFMLLSNGHKGYWVYRRPNLVAKKRDFASAGSEMLRFGNIPAYKIMFSINGAPSASGPFILQHEKVKTVQIKISLQPVTGRVQVERVN